MPASQPVTYSSQRVTGHQSCFSIGKLKQHCAQVSVGWRFGEQRKSTQLALLSSSLFNVSWAPSSGVKAPLATHEGRNWQTLSKKDQAENILGSVGHMISVTTTHFFYYSFQVAIECKHMM